MTRRPVARNSAGPQSGRVLRLPLAGLLCALWAAGCAPSADDPLSRLTTYAPPSGEYRLRYLEPPWEAVEQRGTTAVLRIPSNAMLAGVEAGAPKFELVATVEPGQPAARAAEELRRARERGLEVLGDGIGAVETSEGASGAEVSTRELTRTGFLHRRTVYLPIDGARVLRLAFEATPSLETPEVDAMIAAVGIGPEG